MDLIQYFSIICPPIIITCFPPRFLREKEDLKLMIMDERSDNEQPRSPPWKLTCKAIYINDGYPKGKTPFYGKGEIQEPPPLRLSAYAFYRGSPPPVTQGGGRVNQSVQENKINNNEFFSPTPARLQLPRLFLFLYFSLSLFHTKENPPLQDPTQAPSNFFPKKLLNTYRVGSLFYFEKIFEKVSLSPHAEYICIYIFFHLREPAGAGGPTVVVFTWNTHTLQMKGCAFCILEAAWISGDYVYIRLEDGRWGLTDLKLDI